MKPVLPTRHLDVRAFARSGGSLRGTAPLSDFARVAHDCEGGGAGITVTWSAEGSVRAGAGEALQILLHLLVDAALPLTCQRCLEPVEIPAAVDQWFRFVPDEDTADAQDDDSPEDLLVESAQFDLRELVEDELVLAMPLIPSHAVCPAAPRLSARDPGFDDAPLTKPNAFAVLGKLKSGKDGE
ncbi:MAG: YceD family protein [Burkholderiaceae bacterium]